MKATRMFINLVAAASITFAATSLNAASKVDEGKGEAVTAADTAIRFLAEKIDANDEVEMADLRVDNVKGQFQNDAARWEVEFVSGTTVFSAKLDETGAYEIEKDLNDPKEGFDPAIELPTVEAAYDQDYKGIAEKKIMEAGFELTGVSIVDLDIRDSGTTKGDKRWMVTFEVKIDEEKSDAKGVLFINGKFDSMPNVNLIRMPSFKLGN